MIQRQAEWLRAIVVPLLGAVAFGLLLLFAYARQDRFPVASDRGLAFPSTGFYAAERGPEFTYRWTHPRADITIPGLDRRLEWHLTATAHSWRPPEVPATLRVAVDGVVALERTIVTSQEPIDVVLPPRPARSGATITIDVSPAWVPGGNDPRELGIALEGMWMTPVGGYPRPPRDAIAFGAAAMLVLGAALAAAGPGWPWTSTLMLGAALAQAMLFMRGLAAHGRYPSHVLLLAIGVGAGAWILPRLLQSIARKPWTAAARGVVAVSAVACFLKLLVLLHPTTPLGDGVFHAHRFEYVLDGRFYFTSIAPGDYSFPYPILLYLVSTPFSFLAGDTLDRVALLRIVVTAADAVAGALLYWMIARATSNRAAGVTAVCWYHLIPMTAWIMTWGNLTNAFGQALFVATLASIVALPLDRSRARMIVVTLLAAGALLSHPSTCAILMIVLAATAGLYALGRTAALRESAITVAACAMAAGTAAFVLYYAWFPAVYARELTRVVSESGTHLAAATPEAPMSTRLASIPALAGSYLGWPAIIAAMVGGWRLRDDVTDARLIRLLAGWTGACIAFLVLGVVTPVEMRTYFALFPALAITAAFGCVWAWRRSTVLRVGVVLLVGWAAWVGVAQWVGLFG